MARLLLSLSLLSLVLFNVALAQQRPLREQTRQSRQCCQQNQCDLNNLDALEPTNRIRAEAGETEVWDHTNEQLQCAGVSIIRRRVERNGLVLPSYTNVPQLGYVIQGRGILGVVIPGCPETFQDSQGQIQGEGRQGRQTQDQHQKIRHIRQGDVIAIPAGVAYWYYNHGDQQLVVVSLQDINNAHNQLDFNPRRFFLAGNPEQEFEQGQQSPRFRPRGQQQPGQGQNCNNIFCGFDRQLLAEAFNVNPEVIERIQREDNRNNIVRVEGGLDLAAPAMGRGGRFEEEEEFESRREYDNGLEETFCSMRLRANIGDPRRADVFTPQAGRISSVNSFNLPVLRHIQLSAEMGVLHRNALMVPHSNQNANSIIYAINGNARVQVVDHRGNPVFDGELRQGRVLVVPQNFAVLKRAGEEGFQWVAFKTNDNAKINPLVGRTSVIRGIPNDVLRHAFRMPNEEVSRLKTSRFETTLLSPMSSSRFGRSEA